MADRFLTSTIERSYQLARSGACAGVEDIRRRLRAGGYADATAQVIAVPAMRKDLTRLCLQAQGKFEAVQSGRLSGLRNTNREKA